MQDKHNEVIKWIKQNALSLTLELVGVLVVIVNLWLANKLAPMASDINQLKLQVSAMEQRVADEKPLFERFVRIETVVEDINSRLERIDARLSKHLGI